MDGVEATQQLRELLPEVRVELVSSSRWAGRAETARQVGAAAYVTKPRAVELLVEVVIAWSSTVRNSSPCFSNRPRAGTLPQPVLTTGRSAAADDAGSRADRFRSSISAATSSAALSMVNDAVGILASRQSQACICSPDTFTGEGDEWRDNERSKTVRLRALSALSAVGHSSVRLRSVRTVAASTMSSAARTGHARGRARRDHAPATVPPADAVRAPAAAAEAGRVKRAPRRRPASTVTRCCRRFSRPASPRRRACFSRLTAGSRRPSGSPGWADQPSAPARGVFGHYRGAVR